MLSSLEFKKFIAEKDVEYRNGDLRIVFYNNSLNDKSLSVKHYGWECPSMYNDSPTENGYCDFHNLFELINGQQIGLILSFTEDNYTRQEYLNLLVQDFDTIVVRKDRYERTGLTLKRM